MYTRRKFVTTALGSAAVLTDSGFFSEAAVQKIAQVIAGTPPGTTVYAPLEKIRHHRRVSDLEKKPEPEAPAAGASVSPPHWPRQGQWPFGGVPRPYRARNRQVKTGLPPRAARN